jgi:hypothetical protein
MNEMDLLTDFCEAVSPPEREPLARARAQLLDAARGPAHAAAPTPGGASAGVAGNGTGGPGRRPWRMRNRLAVAGGLAVAMATGLVAAQAITLGGRTPLGTPADAAQLLERAATAAATTAAAQPVPRNNQYIYVETTGLTPAEAGSKKMVRYTTWAWTSVDGMGDFTRQRPCQRDPEIQNRPVCYQAYAWATKLGPGPYVPTSYAALREVPADARQLFAYLASVKTCCPKISGGDLGVWSALTGILEINPVLPPKLAAGIYTVASKLPGVTLLPHATDAAGRTGVGVRYENGDPNGTELIFNLRTYQLMGVGLSAAEFISTGPVLGTRSIAFLHTAVVNSAPRPLVRNGAQAAGS